MTLADASPAPPAPVVWQSSPIYVVWTVDGVVRESSPSYAALVGMSVDEVIGRSWPDLVPGEETLAWQQYRFAVETLRVAPVMVVDMPTGAGGEVHWFRWTEWAVRDDEGNLVAVRSTGVDVTELHSARAALASLFESMVAARTEGRREVVDQLHNGAIQQLVAARWALGIGEVDAAQALVDDALIAVRSSMDTLDPPEPVTARVATSTPWLVTPAGSLHEPLPDDVRAALTDTIAETVTDSVSVLSSTGSLWLSDATRAAFFDDETDVDIASLLAEVHLADRDRLAAAVVNVLGGAPERLSWRFRHPRLGWRRLTSWFTPLPFVVNGPKLAMALTFDITDDVPGADLERMEVQLAERERIARDLHDDALQQLSSLRWMLAGQTASPDVMRQLDAVDEAIRGQLTDLHSVVARFGLDRALHHLLDEVATPVECRWPDSLDTLPVEVADTLFRSAREALRNVDQHARAALASLTIEVDDEVVVLVVRDDGVGVQASAVAAATKAGHLGVSTMRESALASGGRFELAAEDTGGTRMRLELPLR